jgi:hypothetical protein
VVWHLTRNEDRELSFRALGAIEISCCPAPWHVFRRCRRGEGGEYVCVGRGVWVLYAVYQVDAVWEGVLEGSLEDWRTTGVGKDGHLGIATRCLDDWEKMI